jgi:hypothetical protein
MNFDIKRMIESKKTMRRKLAGLPIEKKLELLDLLRERTVAIRGKGVAAVASRIVNKKSPGLPGPKSE